MKTKCLNCGAMIDGYAQFCEACAAENKEKLAASRAALSTSAAMMTCPWCGGIMSRAALRCPSCSRDWIEYHRPATGPGGIRRGDFWVRLVATIIDWIVMLVPSFIIGALFPGWTPTHIAVSVIVGAIFDIGFWTQMGGTPGKLAIGLRVVDDEGELLTFSHAVIRYLCYFLGIFTLGIDVLVIFGEDHKAFHDRVSGSQVVFASSLPTRLPPPPEPQPAG